MGALQSNPTPPPHRKRAEEEIEERHALVSHSGPQDGSPNPVYHTPRSPRAVSRFASLSEPVITLGSLPPNLHNDMTAMSLSAPTTPTASMDVVNPDEPFKPFRILMLMSETGGGHRASAQALEAAFEALYPGQTEMNTVDYWQHVAGFPFHNFPKQYSYVAKRPFLWKFLYLWGQFPPTRWLTEFAFSLFCHARVRRYFENADVDLIISVHPLVNRLSLSVLSYMRRTVGRPTPPFVTVVTDLGGAHVTWFDERADLVYVPSEPLQELAIENGVSEDRIRLFGLPIRPAFWEESRSRDELRKELGMAINMPAVLLVGGGDGVGGLMAIADAIATKIAEEVGTTGGQLVVVCGKNEGLLKRMKARSWPVPVILKGFVENMSEWMSACDVLCSKAGPGTIAEAWIRGLPIILTGYLPGQEEGNVTLVTGSGSGEYHSEPEAIAKCAARWCGDPELRGAIAARATSLGRPNSCKEIAADIWDLGQERLVEREAFARRMLQAPPGSHVPNGYIAMAKYYVGSAARSVQRGMFGLLGYQHAELIRPRE